MSCTQQSGTCETCKSACTNKPGWFLPGEAEKAAELLGLSFEAFFKKYLGVDWWEAGADMKETVFLLAPAIVGEHKGTEYPGDPRGKCVFFKKGRCQIHDAKPHECREYWCGENRDDVVSKRHLFVAQQWQAHQQQITDLLGREPEAEEYEGSIFGSLFDW